MMASEPGDALLPYDALQALLAARSPPDLQAALTDIGACCASCSPADLNAALAKVDAETLRSDAVKRRILRSFNDDSLGESEREIAEELLACVEAVPPDDVVDVKVEACIAWAALWPEFDPAPCEPLRVSAQVLHSRGARADWRQSPVPLMLWPSARIMADFLLSVPQLTRGRSVLELGCGAHGLVAVAAAHAGAATVLATDLDATAVARTAACLERNSTACARAAVLDWSCPRACSGIEGDELFELVLAADCVGVVGAGVALVGTLRHLLSPGGLAIILNGGARHRFGAEELGVALEAEDCLSFQTFSVPMAAIQHLESAVASSQDDGLHVQSMEYDVYVVRAS